jgi:2-polyprenyl-3-methyl-5-hydroxy-6-metoxy-1,4-benzoquinol methylase
MLSLDRQEILRHRYAESRRGWKPSSQVYENLVADHLTPSTRVLDLGCGRGGVLERLHDRAGLVLGLDPDLSSLYEHRMREIVLTAGNAGALPYASDTFDLVTCSWVLEHLADPDAVLCDVARVLHAGGAFVFLTPNLLHPLTALNWAAGKGRGRLVSQVYARAEEDTFPVFYRANTPARIRRLTSAAGLVYVSLQSVGDPTYLGFSRALFWLGRLLERVTPARLKLHLVGECVAG